MCWNLKTEFVTRSEALAIYERNWRLIDQEALDPDERNLLDELIDELGGGVVNA